MSMKINRLLIPLLLLTVACGGGGSPAGEPSTGAAGDASASLAPRRVVVVTPEARLVTEEVEAIGSLLPFNEAAVAADVEGTVTDTMVEVGEVVDAGAPLADIDRVTFKLRLAQAEANLAQAEAQAALADKELARKQQLLDDRTISQAVLDTYVAQAELARAGVAAARAARDLAADSYEKSRLKAPIAGVVAARLVDAGDRVGVGSVLYRIARVDRLKLVFSLPEAYARRVQPLREVRFTAGGTTDSHIARRWTIAPVVNSETRTVECTFAVDNRDRSVPAGASARVTARFPDKRTHWVLPRTALTLEELPRVFVVEGGVARPRVVEVATVTDSEVELLTGVDEGTPVIADATGIFDGVPVAPEGGALQ